MTDEESNLIRPIQVMEREQKELDAKYKMFINRSLTDVRNLKTETFKKMEAADIPKALMDLGMSDLSWEIEKVYTYSRKPIEEEECTEEKGDKKEEKYYCIGRFVCNSIQCMSKAHRAMIFGDYVELDLSLAGPSAFLDLGQFFFQNMDLRSLKRYITDSESVRAEIIDENKNFIDANPQIKHNRVTEDKKLKDQLRNYMYNSSPLNNQCKLFKDIVQQARDVVDSIDEKEYLLGIKNYIVKTSEPNKDKKLARNTFAALISMTYESNLIHQVIKRRLKELGIDVKIQLFDGLYIHKDAVTDLQALQKDINDTIKNSPVYMFSEEAKELVKICSNDHFESNMRVKIKRLETFHLSTWQERSLIDIGVPADRFSINTTDYRLVDGDRPTIAFDQLYKTKYNCIASAMKSGKTFYCNAFINYVAKEHPTTTILIVTNRVSQGHVAAARFKIKDADEVKEFFMYNTKCDTKGCKKSRGVCSHTRDAMITKKYIVCQWESLFHLSEINKTFDVVVLDEHLSVSCQAVSETNQDMAYRNYFFYRYVSEHARCNLFLDDDALSTRISSRFIQISLDPNFSDTRFYIYTKRAMARSYVVRKLKNQYQMLQQDVQKINVNKEYRIGLIFSSKREL